MSQTILITDDDINVLKLFSLDLEQRNVNVQVRTAERAAEAIAHIDSEVPDILVLDLRMTGGDGFTVLDHLKAKQHDIPVVVLTNYRTDTYLEKCRSYGVKEYIVKHETRMDRVVEKVTSYLAM